LIGKKRLPPEKKSSKEGTLLKLKKKRHLWGGGFYISFGVQRRVDERLRKKGVGEMKPARGSLGYTRSIMKK